MDKTICRFTEGMITLPQGYCERTLNTLAGTRSTLPPITISRDKLGDHNNPEEYILSQLAILQKQMKDWQQEVHQPVVLGNNLTTGIMITMISFGQIIFVFTRNKRYSHLTWTTC